MGDLYGKDGKLKVHFQKLWGEAALPRWAALSCSIVAVVVGAEKVEKSSKLGIALDGMVWYYEGATQLHIVPCL